jgi:hypothetical protein
MTTATVRGRNDEPVTVKVGDVVGFKSDYEQYGKITAIENAKWGRGKLLTLENPNGFGGDYLRYATKTTESADDCWKD